MTFSKGFRISVLAVVLTLGVSLLGAQKFFPNTLSFVTPANAEVGRPLTPVSVAGVARRNNRR